MTVTEDAPAAAPASESTAPRPAPPGLAAVLGTGDHQVVGRIWLVTAMVHLVLVGVVNVLVAAERIDPDSFSVIDADWIIQADTFRYVGSVFLVLLPLTIAVATSIVPQQVGSRTIAFPRAAASAAWGYLLGGALVVAAYAMKGGAGGTDRDGVVLFVVALGLVAVSLVVAWISIVTTVLGLRTTGMGLRRAPLFAWSALVAGGVWILTLPVLVGLAVISYLDARYGGFLDGSSTGLYDRIAWTFGTPTIYVAAVPVVGFVASVVPVFAQTRHHLHRVAMGLIGALGVLSVGAWTIPSLGGQLRFLYEGPWVVVSIAALLPLLGLVGLWGATVQRGKLTLGSPLLFGIAALLLALLGVAAGAVQAIEPIETLTDEGLATTLYGTSWSSGVLALLVVAGITAALGGVVYWAPQILGTRVHEGGARLLALLLLAGGAVGGIGALGAGLLGEPGPAELAAVDNLDAVKTLDLVQTAGDAILGLAGIVAILLLLKAAAGRSDAAEADPWSGHTLEWAAGDLPKVASEAPLYDARHGQEADA